MLGIQHAGRNCWIYERGKTVNIHLPALKFIETLIIGCSWVLMHRLQRNSTYVLEVCRNQIIPR
jgi:hypothetical protein